MRRTIYETNFEKLAKIGIIQADGSLNFQEAMKMKKEGYMDLNLDFLTIDIEKRIIISMAHNYKKCIARTGNSTIRS